jgi:hypothetical protein
MRELSKKVRKEKWEEEGKENERKNLKPQKT